MGAPPPYTGYAFPGMDNLHHDIYPAISAAATPSLKQEGKVVLITGASRGIGRAITIQYASAGVAALVLCARSAETLSAVEKEVNAISSSIKVHKFPLDVTSESDVQACFEKVQSLEGRLDVLVNNAGTSAPWVSITESTPSTWFKDFEVNIKGPYLFLHFFLPLLVATAEKYGQTTDVVNMSSIGAHAMLPGASSYSTTKLALCRLTEFVDGEVGGKGVVTTAVHPGAVPTDLASGVEQLEGFLIDTPELCGGFLVWLTKGERKWLAGRYVSATWNVEKLESMSEDIEKRDLLKVRMAV